MGMGRDGYLDNDHCAITELLCLFSTKPGHTLWESIVVIQVTPFFRRGINAWMGLKNSMQSF